MNQKVLVLGASGMAGHVVSLFLREHGFSVDTLSHNRKLDDATFLVDVLDGGRLEPILDRGDYATVVNCVGLLVKQSEEKKDDAVLLNAYLPHYLERYYADESCKVIHLSTDCVFSGQNAPYDEHSLHDGRSFYDRSKALGEIINSKDLTFRMSIVGPDLHTEGVGLFNWFMQQKGSLDGFDKAIWSGITTIELAKGIEAAIAQDLTGLYHLVPTRSISKYELLKLFNVEFSRGITVRRSNSGDADKTLVNTRTDFAHVVSDYSTMVAEMRQWINSHPGLYPHYFRGDSA